LPRRKRKERPLRGSTGEKVFSLEILWLFECGESILELFKASSRFGQASESIGV
jgi:hypothetical protein